MSLMFMLIDIFDKLYLKKGLELVFRPTPYPEVMTKPISKRYPPNTKNQASLSYSSKCIPPHMATQPLQWVPHVSQSRGL